MSPVSTFFSGFEVSYNHQAHIGTTAFPTKSEIFDIGSFISPGIGLATVEEKLAPT